LLARTRTFVSLFANDSVPYCQGAIHINLWLFKGLAAKNGQEVELIIHDFKFTPE